MYGKDLLVLLEFSNHGMLTYNVLHQSGAYVEVDFATKLFDSSKFLAMLKTEVSRHTTMVKAVEGQRVAFSVSEVIPPERLHNWMTSLLNVQLPWLAGFSHSVARPTTLCDDQFVYYEPTDSSWVVVDQHYCCARICLDIDYINAPGILSTDQCCSFCNGVACPTHEDTPIAAIISVMISNYGWLDGDIATIVL